MEDSDSCSGPKEHWPVQFALLTFAYSKILWFDGLLVPLFVFVSFCGDVCAVPFRACATSLSAKSWAMTRTADSTEGWRGRKRETREPVFLVEGLRGVAWLPEPLELPWCSRSAPCYIFFLCFLVVHVCFAFLEGSGMIVCLLCVWLCLTCLGHLLFPVLHLDPFC